MSTAADHPIALFGGALGSPLGGAIFTYLTRTQHCTPTHTTLAGYSYSGEFCSYDYNPGGGVLATVIGLVITGSWIAFADWQANRTPS